MNLMMKYQLALDVLCNDVDTLIKEYADRNNYNPVNHTEYRIKSLKSAYAKLERKGYDLTDENLYNHVRDMVGYRLVCNFLSEISTIVELIEKSKQLRIISRKDYITHPKETGYLSYHLIVEVPIYLSTGIEYVKAEIQIRTLAMNFWAALDHMIQYKFPDEKMPQEISKELYDISLQVSKLDNKMLLLNEMMSKYKE